jgi:hypothetical protein
MYKNLKSGLLGLVVAVLCGMPACFSAAHADTFDFTFSGDGFSASGVFTASPDPAAGTGDFAVTSLSGVLSTGSGPSSSMALIPPGGYALNDNILQEFSPGVYGPDQPFGISFTANSINYEIYDAEDTATFALIASNLGGLIPLTEFSVTAAPLPSTWMMLLGGLIALGFVATRGTNSGALETA